MSDPKDLTRWNRAGLSRFNYVDGNAVEYLEFLRRELAANFSGTNWISPPEPVPAAEQPRPNETVSEEQKRLHLRNERLRQAYFGERRDWAWEISRTFARACHILTGYVDAWANEGYLGTATQWDNVRRIVGLLDYYPAPPASATTSLVLHAKKGASGLVGKGFQVKNAPPMGAEKVTFETLEDLFIDETLNELRPKGWDKSQDPAGTPPAGGEREFSPVAKGPVESIEEVGVKHKAALGKLDAIYKLYAASPEQLASTGLRQDFLWEVRAKATIICDFDPGPEWNTLLSWRLPAILEEPTVSLAGKAGSSVESARTLQFNVALLGACLDQSVFAKTTLEEFRTRSTREGDGAGSSSRHRDSWRTPWRGIQKPRLAAGQMALVYHRAEDKAEAVTITGIEPPDDRILVVPGHAEPDWHRWPKGEAVLRVAPRWKRKCWLNGADVIRTKAPHGLAAGTYICWKDREGTYQYAGIRKADRQNLWLDAAMKKDQWPQPGTEIMVALPINTRTMSAQLKALNPDAAKATVKDKEMDFPPEVQLPFQVYKPYQLTGAASGGGGGGGGLLPPASLPGLGSFLFPSPLLPIDLVKLAVELLLSMGLMVIPSTGIPVFKGMPFGPSLGNAESIADAAKALIDMLDSLTLPGKWDANGWLVDLDDKPLYLEAICIDGHVYPASGLINSGGTSAQGVHCLNGRAVDVSKKAVGFQPHKSHFAGQVLTSGAPMVAWKSGVEKNKAMAEVLASKTAGASAAIFQTIQRDNTASGAGALPEPLLAVMKGAPVIRGIVAPQESMYIFDGAPDKVEAGDWIIGKFETGSIRALKVMAIDDVDTGTADKAFGLSVSGISGNMGPLDTICADFRGEIVADGAHVNTKTLGATVELATVPPTLTPGRKVLLMAAGKKPVAARVTRIEGNEITTDPPPKDYTAGELVICGNVVAAGHGIAKPAVILGSGNAAQTHQEFTLEVKGVSFTPDPTTRSGFAAAVEVEVAGRLWQQVSSLKDSQPGDHHYAVRMTEEGYIRFLFGDGRNGRRLPTGRNNVRVRYRLGCGLSGNLPPHRLEEVVNPHPLVKSVFQPADAVGGGDMESTESLRNTAPATLLALERAVSLSDFADLAKGRSDVWQAQARCEVTNSGRRDEVIVTIVPAGGTTSDKRLEDVRLYLEAHALPELQVIVKRFTPATDFSLDILVRVDSSAYLPEEVVTAVTRTLVSRFSLENRRLGAGLYLSEIYKTVEGITGVENSVCLLTSAGKAVPVVRAGDAQTVVYLDPNHLYVHHEEYTP